MSLKYAVLATIATIAALGTARAQTQINLRSQAHAVDFSTATSTKPAQTGYTLPATCSAGAVFLSLSNPPGQNVYVCTGTNVWSLQTGGGGANPNSPVVTASGNTMTIGGNCGAIAPCNFRVGGTVYSYTGGMTATLTGGTGTAYIYLSAAGNVTVGHNLSLSCAGGCAAVQNVTAFPSDAYPIAIWGASNGVWNASGQDARAPSGRDLVIAGRGLTGISSGGSTSLSVPAQQGGFGVSFRGSDVAVGSAIYLTVPFACSITDWTITSDATATITLWRVADGGSALPTNANSINTVGLSLSSGTRIHSTTLTDFTSTLLSAYDTIAVSLAAVASQATHVEFNLGCSK